MNINFHVLDGVLNIVKKSGTPFYLTGGTALSRGYFDHRYSDTCKMKGEFDVIGVTETSVFLAETKSSPNEEYLLKFIENINLFKKLFPEYEDKPVIPLFASLRFDDDLIRLCTAKNIYVLAYREWDYMDILNFNDICQSSKNITPDRV